MASGRLAFTSNSLLLRLDLFLMTLGLLGVLLGKGPVLRRLVALLVDRRPELLRPGGMGISFLAVAGGLGGESLPLEPSLLRATADQRDRERDDEHRGDDDGDDENR